jgi:hypothetical protein
MMKRFLSLLVLFAAFVGYGQSAISVVYSFVNGLGQVQTVKQVSFTPMAIGVYSNSVVVGEEVTAIVTDNTLTNPMLSGFAYRVKYFSSIQPPVVSTMFTNYFPTNITPGSVVFAKDYVAVSTNLGNGIYALTRAQADASYVPLGNGSGLTNLNAVTQIIFTNAAPGFSYTNSAGLVVLGTNAASGGGITATIITNLVRYSTTLTNQYYISNAPSSDYSGTYTFKTIVSTNSKSYPLYTNANGKALFNYIADNGGWVIQSGSTYDSSFTIWVYDNYSLSEIVNASWEDSQTSGAIAIKSFGLTYQTPLTLPSGDGILLTNLSISAVNNSSISNAQTVLVNGGGITNLNAHPFYFTQWPDELDALTDSYFCQLQTNGWYVAAPPSNTNQYMVTYTNGFLQFSNGAGFASNNFSMLVLLTNSFAVAGHPVILDMSGCVPGQTAAQMYDSDIGFSTDKQFYPPYSGSSFTPVQNYTLGISSQYQGKNKWIFICAGGNDLAFSQTAAATYTRVYNLCKKHKDAGDTVILATYPVNFNNQGNATWISYNNMLRTNVMPCDLKIDLDFLTLGYQSVSGNYIDGIHPSKTLATNWNNIVWKEITNNFVVSQGYLGGVLTNIPSTSIIGGMTTNLQLSLGTARTNTLYFTNGILMKVTNP